jgi:hypothetical protein
MELQHMSDLSQAIQNLSQTMLATAQSLLPNLDLEMDISIEGNTATTLITDKAQKAIWSVSLTFEILDDNTIEMASRIEDPTSMVRYPAALCFIFAPYRVVSHLVRTHDGWSLTSQPSLILED